MTAALARTVGRGELEVLIRSRVARDIGQPPFTETEIDVARRMHRAGAILRHIADRLSEIGAERSTGDVQLLLDALARRQP